MRHSAIALALLACSGGYASQSYKPPAGGQAWTVTKCYLRSASEKSAARGVAVFLCNESERQHRVQLFARDLQPNGVYSLWLVADSHADRPARARRLTRRVRPQRASGNGEFRLVVATLECLVGDYDSVVLRHHPPGNRIGPRSGQAVLSGAINHEAHEASGGS
jgi:hypothetical protein